MSGQGKEGEGMAVGITAKWQGGRKKGRLGRTEQSLCLSPVPGDCEPAHRGHAEWGGRERETMVCNKIACSTARSHLSKSATGDWETQTHNAVP